MKLLVGLGNPGRKYSKTRHNIGFEIIDNFADEISVKIGKKKFSAVFEMGRLEKCELCLIKPQTFMNLSGEAVSAFVDYFKIDVEDVIVVHDDLDISLGRLKFGFGGGDGGHNGVRSIADMLENREFWRLRVGIGRPPEGVDPADFVLDEFLEEEYRKIKDIIALSSEALQIYFVEGPNKAMQKFHSLATA